MTCTYKYNVTYANGALRHDARDTPDLRGFTIGSTPPLGATVVSIGLDRILQSAGLSMADVDVRPLSFADINSALAGGAIDAARTRLQPLRS